jgi:hypothetical protein
MLDLLTSIDRRTKYLDAALGKGTPAVVSFVLPNEPWADQFRGLGSCVPANVMPNLSRLYGTEAADRGESPVVTMLRNAANGETPLLDAEIELRLMQFPDCGEAFTKEFLLEQFPAQEV